MTDPLIIRDEAWVAEQFGEDASSAPSNEIVIDPEAEDAPNTDHP